MKAFDVFFAPPHFTSDLLCVRSLDFVKARVLSPVADDCF